MGILCMLGIHDWSFSELWEPDFNAVKITRNTMWKKCNCCGKEEKIYDTLFDPNTGEPISVKESDLK
jgi:hypothetical protein